MITAYIGVMGSGKNFRADLLIKKGYVTLDFKDALILMCEDLLGYTIRDNYEDFKSTVVGLGPPDRMVNAARMSVRNESKRILTWFPKAMTGRILLQRLGTEVMRRRDPDYWVKAWQDRARELIANAKDIVCADCRFENEMRAIRHVATVTHVPHQFIFCDYHSQRYDARQTHDSEKLAQYYLSKGYKDGDEIT